MGTPSSFLCLAFSLSTLNPLSITSLSSNHPQRSSIYTRPSILPSPIPLTHSSSPILITTYLERVGRITLLGEWCENDGSLDFTAFCWLTRASAHSASCMSPFLSGAGVMSTFLQPTHLHMLEHGILAWRQCTEL